MTHYSECHILIVKLHQRGRDLEYFIQQFIQSNGKENSETHN